MGKIFGDKNKYFIKFNDLELFLLSSRAFFLFSQHPEIERMFSLKRQKDSRNQNGISILQAFLGLWDLFRLRPCLQFQLISLLKKKWWIAGIENFWSIIHLFRFANISIRSTRIRNVAGPMINSHQRTKGIEQLALRAVLCLHIRRGTKANYFTASPAGTFHPGPKNESNIN